MPAGQKNGSRNIFYDFMRLVRPGDLIFSYAGGVSRGIGAVANLGVFTLQVLNSSSINKPTSNGVDQRHVERYFYNTYQLKVVLNWYSRGD